MSQRRETLTEHIDVRCIRPGRFEAVCTERDLDDRQPLGVFTTQAAALDAAIYHLRRDHLAPLQRMLVWQDGRCYDADQLIL